MFVQFVKPCFEICIWWSKWTSSTKCKDSHLEFVEHRRYWHDQYEVSQDPVCVCVFFSLNDRRGDTWSNVNQNLIWKRIPDVYPNMMKRSYLKTQMFRFLGSSKLSFKYWCCQCLIEGESTVTLASNNCFQTKISKSMKRFPRYEFSSFLVGEWDLFTVLPENISLKKGDDLGMLPQVTPKPASCMEM